MSADPIFQLFEGLPRGGPGSDAETLAALERLPALPDSARVLDLGCGPGRQTRVLARALQTVVEGVDVHRPFLDQLERAAADAGLSQLVRATEGDMGALALPPASVDLIWSEGAIYLLGFEAGLRTWRPWLKPGGLVVVSEATWFSAEPPAAARAFWDVGYPDMQTIAGNRARAEAAGYEVLDAWPLPSAAWWPEYYEPLLARVTALEAGEPDAVMAAVLAETRREIELFRAHHDSYGYAFYALQRRPA